MRPITSRRGLSSRRDAALGPARREAISHLSLTFSRAWGQLRGKPHRHQRNSQQESACPARKRLKDYRHEERPSPTALVSAGLLSAVVGLLTPSASYAAGGASNGPSAAQKSSRPPFYAGLPAGPPVCVPIGIVVLDMAAFNGGVLIAAGQQTGRGTNGCVLPTPRAGHQPALLACRLDRIPAPHAVRALVSGVEGICDAP